MIELLKRNYWWLYLNKDIKKYIGKCEMCQRLKVGKATLLKPNMVPKHHGSDLISPLPMSKGKNGMFVMILDCHMDHSQLDALGRP
jgi:hypothetical protein